MNSCLRFADKLILTAAGASLFRARFLVPVFGAYIGDLRVTLENAAIANALQLEAIRHRASPRPL